MKANQRLALTITALLASLAALTWAAADPPDGPDEDAETVAPPAPGASYANYVCITAYCTGVRMLSSTGGLAGCNYSPTGNPPCTGKCTYCVAAGSTSVNVCKAFPHETCDFPSGTPPTNCGRDFQTDCYYSTSPRAPTQPCWCSNTGGVANPGGGLCSSVANCQ